MYIFGGNWHDFLATFFIGMIGFSVAYFTKNWLNIKFLDDFLANFHNWFIGLFSSEIPSSWKYR